MDIKKEKILLGVITLLLVLVAVLATLVVLRYRPIAVIEPIGIEDVKDEKPSRDKVNSRDKVSDDVAPVFFSTMTHLEGGWDFVEKKESMFDDQANKLRIAMDYAEQYDAILTFESEMPFSRAMVQWGDNVFQEALDRGMGIGTHCDITPRSDFSDEEIIDEISQRKELVDAVVDSSENLGCAGAGGMSDWYEGMVGAGFKYIDGVVGFHYLALPLSERPDGWDDKSIFDEYYHNASPADPDKKYYPFRIGRVGFTEDPTGDLVVSAGDIGEISSIGDLALSGSGDWQAECGTSCAIDMADVDAIDAAIRSFVETRDTSRVAKLQVYIATTKYEDPGIELFFERMQVLQDEGVIQWASQKQVYDAFVQWENR
jgi:hypothetical protein